MLVLVTAQFYNTDPLEGPNVAKNEEDVIQLAWCYREI